MLKAPFEIQVKFIDFLNKDISIADFEQWLYVTPQLEDILCEADYLELLTYNYQNKKFARLEIRPILEKFIEYDKYETQYLLNLLSGIKNKDNQVNYLCSCYDLYCKGYKFLDNLGIGFGLKILVPHEFGANTWSDLGEVTQQDILDSFYPDAAIEAQKVIDWIKGNKVVPLGEQGPYGELLFKDYRTKEEKSPTTYTKDKIQ